MRPASLCTLVAVSLLACATLATSGEAGTPVLVYHRFGPVAADAMTVRTEVFAAHLRTLKELGYTVIPARQLVDFLRGDGPPPPEHAVVITADDGHRSVFSDMRPLVVRDRVPVTLFVYPSAISRADYALTWEQLAELRASGLFDVQSHTWWHPNFHKERQKLSASQFAPFVTKQLERSRTEIEAHLGGPVDLLAWPFGIHDDEVRRLARDAHYLAGFTLERRHAVAGDDPMAIPRYLMVDGVSERAFERLLAGSSR